MYGFSDPGRDERGERVVAGRIQQPGGGWVLSIVSVLQSVTTVARVIKDGPGAGRVDSAGCGVCHSHPWDICQQVIRFRCDWR